MFLFFIVAIQSNIWGPQRNFGKGIPDDTYTGTFYNDKYKPPFYHPIKTVLCTTAASQSLLYVLMITVGYLQCHNTEVIHLGF